MTLLGRLEKNLDFWFLTSSLFFFFLLRLPSLFEPYWYGDEGIYQTIGLALSRGAVLYRDIWDNKPPGLYYLYSIFAGDQFLLKLLSLIFGIVAVIAFFFLAKKIFLKPLAYRTSTLLFAFLFGIPLLEGNIANAENFMIPIEIISAFLIFKFIKEKNNKLLMLSGILLGISFLLKIVAIFDFGAFFIFLFIFDFPSKINLRNIQNQIIEKLPTLLIFSISFIVPFFISLLYFWFMKIPSLYISSIFFSNIGYVGYGNKFIIPQGLLILKVGFLGASLILIFIKRFYLQTIPSILILIWLVFSFFNSFFSQRPYTHYVLVVLPAFCLIYGLIFIKQNISKLMLIIFILSALTAFHFFSLYGKNYSYYKNFLMFITYQKSVSDYQLFFDRNTPRDYEISSFIKMNTKKDDNIFIWGNNAEVYKLTNKIPPGKYTVMYHITQYKDGESNTIKGLKMNNPKYIVLMPNAARFPFSLYNYKIKINLRGATIYERII